MAYKNPPQTRRSPAASSGGFLLSLRVANCTVRILETYAANLERFLDSAEPPSPGEDLTLVIQRYRRTARSNSALS